MPGAIASFVCNLCFFACQMSSSRIDRLLAMLQADESDVFCHYALGQEYVKAGNLEASMASYRRALELDPDHHYAAFHLAMTLERAGRVPEALETLRSALHRATRPEDAKAREEIQREIDRLSAGIS